MFVQQVHWSSGAMKPTSTSAMTPDTGSDRLPGHQVSRTEVSGQGCMKGYYKDKN